LALDRAGRGHSYPAFHSAPTPFFLARISHIIYKRSLLKLL